MKGYTIQHSIELLEKNQSGGTSSADKVSYNNTGTSLASTTVQAAISEISERFDYSTTEKVVGKWTDGSELFLKTFTGTTASSTTTTTLADVGLGNTIRNFDGVIDGSRPVSSYLDNQSNSATWVAANGHELGNISTGSIYQGKDYFVRVFYTKPVQSTRKTKKK